MHDYSDSDGPADWETPSWAPPLSAPAGPGGGGHLGGTAAGPAEYGDDLEAAIAEMADAGEPFLMVAPVGGDPLLVPLATLSPFTGPRVLATFEQVWPQMPDGIDVYITLVDPDNDRIAELEMGGWPLASEQAEAVADACTEIFDGLLLYRSRLVWRGFTAERSVSIDPSPISGRWPQCAAGASVDGAGSAVTFMVRAGGKLRGWQIAVPHPAAAAAGAFAALAVALRRFSRRRNRQQP